jgi:hypothetical protein
MIVDSIDSQRARESKRPGSRAHFVRGRYYSDIADRRESFGQRDYTGRVNAVIIGD